MMAALGCVPPNRRVRVWFGGHELADFIGPPEDAATYEAGMRQRFASLRAGERGGESRCRRLVKGQRRRSWWMDEER